jgi:periplasmic protein TonB
LATSPAAASDSAPFVDKAAEILPQESYLRINFNLIRTRVASRVRYPALARRLGWEGQVKVEFTVLLSGEISNLHVAKSSGHPILDRQALRAVEVAAPFPPPPVIATLTLPVNFKLD